MWRQRGLGEREGGREWRELVFYILAWFSVANQRNKHMRELPTVTAGTGRDLGSSGEIWLLRMTSVSKGQAYDLTVATWAEAREKEAEPQRMPFLANRSCLVFSLDSGFN